MITTLVILLAMVAMVFYRSAPDASGRFFLSRDFTTTLKGLCAIVVIFIHVPDAWSNTGQETIGRFAYVAVTIFFLFSAYGMMYSLEHNPGYMKTFWRNRLLSLLIPQAMINIVYFILKRLVDVPVGFDFLLIVNEYVWILLEYCLAFYIVVTLARHFKARTNRPIYLSLAALIVGSSLWSYFYGEDNVTHTLSGWPYERLGLLWGLIIYRYKGTLERLLTSRHRRRQMLVTGLMCAILGVAYLRYKAVWFTGEYCVKILLGVAIIMLLFELSHGRRYFNAATRFLGNCSYEIYLSHGIVMKTLAILLPTLSSNLFLALTFGLTIGLSWPIHYFGNNLVNLFRAPSPEKAAVSQTAPKIRHYEQ